MKANLNIATLALLSIFGLPPSALLHAAATIDTTNKYAYGANIGWLDWRGDTNNGAVIGEYVCSGYIYAANVGWISLGSGSPANQIQYQNNSASDFGVNHDGAGNLTGYAYGANIGWINFEQTYGQPKVDLYTGKLSGSVWSANCGWISLSNAVAFVQTTSIKPGTDSDLDGIADAYELTYTNTLAGMSQFTDSDGDGVSDKNEYLAGTNPKDANSVLRITYFARNPATFINTMYWNGLSSRFYAVQTNTDLANGIWADRVAFTIPGASSMVGADITPTNCFYRLRVFRPLMP